MLATLESLVHSRIAIGPTVPNHRLTVVTAIANRTASTDAALWSQLNCACLAATPQARRRFDRARLIVEGLFTSSACARQQAVLDHDYAFFAGDLNYRIELDRQVIESRIFDRSLGTLRLYPCVLRRLSKAGGTPFYFQWLCVAADSLLSADQLLQQQARGSCFVGWLESPIRFIPTCVRELQLLVASQLL
jgi:hypothetical protein